MSSGIPSSVKDAHHDLRKQIGCINVIFQLFDRHHFFTGKRADCHNNKKPVTGANHNGEPRIATEMEVERVVGSDESYKVLSSSSSSPCPSTPSSLDRNKTATQESPSCAQTNFSRIPEALDMDQHKPSLHSSRQSPDRRSAVKNLMYRDDCTLSVKTGAREEDRIRVMKHIDSPRPLQQSPDLRDVVKNSMYRDKEEGRVRVMKHIDSPRPSKPSAVVSTRGHARFQEAPFSFKEDRDHTMQHAGRDPCRFSYDGIESRETLKSTTKQGELPRLSLDSRVRSIRNRYEGDENSVSTPTRNEELGSHRRSSSVVAKLMGLEGFPEPTSINDDQVLQERFISVENSVPISQGLGQHSKQNQETSSSQDSQKDCVLPHSRPTKPTSYSRFPLELAPWRLSDSSRAPQKTLLRSKEASTNPQQISSSVYSEVEKRITELELDKSGKDLRALKQILEAMQKTRARLESQTQEVADFDTDSQSNSFATDYGCHQQSPRLSMQQRQQCDHSSPTEKRSCPPKRVKSSNPIKQSAKLNVQIRVASSSTRNRDDSVNKDRKNSTLRKNIIKDPTQNLPSIEKINQRTSNALQASKGSAHMNGGRHPVLDRSPGAVSPRLQKKKLGIEKQSEPSRIRRKENKQPKESESSNRRPKLKSANQRQSYNHLSEISSDTGNFSEQGDTASVQSESNNSLASYMETEVTSTYHNIEMGAKQQVVHKETNSEMRLRKDTMMAELAMATIEQPSPVSVLDATFYIEDSPSPVKKKISIAFGDANEEEWHTEGLDHLPFSTRHNLSSEFNHKSLENVDHLLHKLRLLNSTPREGAMNEIALFCQGDNSDHWYITKILLASGLLKDLDCVSTTAQLHPSGYLINPKLFHVLEQTEESTWLTCKGPQENTAKIKFEEKIHRKVVFDTVNEILAHKLALEGSLMQERNFSGQQLLKELYAEVDHLRPESDNFLGTADDELIKIIKGDLKHELEDWVEHRGELPALVLDIERLIFKDLITEVISREVAWLQDRPRRHSMQLFMN
ncbi:PREDICTED: protein LONGIFOLIA 1-like isoform X2 [Ipomoea nil]|uniref:protein LONGIFOLIA 1-like isoform X2 n=1 Tax=Ipomoea nil TaxID=35883 RepID=UPI000900ED75|nr:PREDICTED: protein LONGIFOLIA 1-like isoform X2 [Ipomoea nil]